MLKKCLHIFIAAWLINALVCYHPTAPFGGVGHPVQYTETDYSADNTIVDILVNHADDGPDDHPHRVFSHARYLVSRTIGFNLQLPTLQTFHCLNTAIDVPLAFHRFWESKVFLPPHHHFLFRLSPF